MGRECGTYGERCKDGFGKETWKLQGKRQLGTPRSKWDDTELDLKQIGRDNANWINLA
jgi:hypothetical protein